jgi:hypothetical protein
MSENEDYEIEFYRNDIQNALDSQTEKFKPEIKEINEETYQKTDMLKFVNDFHQQNIDCKDEEGTIIINLGSKSFKLCASKGDLIRTLNVLMDKKKEDVPEYVDPEEFKKNGAEVFGMISFMLPPMIVNAKAMQKVGYKYMPLNYSMNNQNFATFMEVESAIDWLKNIKPKDMFESMNSTGFPSDFFKNIGSDQPEDSKEDENNNEMSPNENQKE